jgi:hypothetical protein
VQEGRGREERGGESEAEKERREEEDGERIKNWKMRR